MLINDRFFRIAHGKLVPEMFADPRAARVYGIQCKFYAKNGRCGSFDEIWSSEDIQSEPTAAEQNSLRGIMQTAKNETLAFGLDVIKREMTEWLHAHIFASSMTKAISLYNNKKYREAYDLAQVKVHEIRTTTFEDDQHLSFLDPATYLKQAELSYDNALTTGLTILDDALVPNNDSKGKGGLLEGDITIVMAPANVGKTSCLITMAVQNAMLGKKVLFMTHEGRPADIREKMLRNAIGLTQNELLEAYKTEQGLKTLEFFANRLEKSLTYVPYNKAGMVVEDVIPIIRRRQEQLQVMNDGHGFDLIVSDYPAKLGTSTMQGKNEKRHTDAIVYENYVQLALELECHVVAAVQTNRQGSVANKDDERLLTMEDVAESWGVMTAATNVLTLNRDLKAALNNRLTFYVAKSRSSEVGRAIVARTDYSRTITHSDKLGGTWYRGHHSMERIDDLLTKYNGTAIPDIIAGGGHG